MTFSIYKKRGNLLLSTLLSVLGVTSAFFVLNFSLNLYRGSLRNTQEGSTMLLAHSIAALLKDDIRSNYANYTDTSNPTWAPCRVSPSVTEFINRLNNATGACGAVNFSFSQFETIPTVGQTSQTTLPLSQLSPVQNSPVKAFRPLNSLQLYGFDIVVTITSFNSAADRNLLQGTIQLTSSNPSLTVNKSIPMAIDIGKAVFPPLGRASAKLCRAVAGALCEVGAGQLDLTFLDSGGQILRVAPDQNILSTGWTAPLTAVSVKNIVDQTSKSEYSLNSFCLPNNPSVPVPWILDAATDTAGNTYYLTVHGMLLDSTGTNRWAQNDPKFISIAYDNVTWLLLRSDGTVFRTTNILTLDSLEEVVKISTAIAITTGKGPNPC